MATNNLVVAIKADLAGFSDDMDKVVKKTADTANEVVGFGRSMDQGVSRPASNAGRQLRVLEGGASKLDRTLRQVATGGLKLSATFGGLSPEIARTGSEIARTAYEIGELKEKLGKLKVLNPAMIMAGLSNPLIITGIIATTAAVSALAYAWKKAKEEREIAMSDVGFGAHITKVEDLDPRRMKFSEMTGRRAHMLEAVGVSAAAPGTGAEMTLAGRLAGDAIEQWKQAAAQIRPVTNTIVNDWNVAFGEVNRLISNSTNFTKDQVAELYSLRNALLEVRKVAAPPIAKSSQFRTINQTTGLQSLSPGQYLGSGMMNATPDSLGLKQTGQLEMAFRTGWQSVREAIIRDLPMTLAGLIRTQTKAGGIGAFLGGAFGGGVGTALGGMAGKAIGGTLGAGIGSIIPGIGTLVGGAVGGWLGDKLGGLFGRKKRRQAEENSADALLKMAKAAERVTEAITNIPTGIKIAAYRFGASDPEKPPPSSTPPGSNDPTKGTGPRGAYIQVENMTVVANDPRELGEKLAREAELNAARGGVTALTLSTTRTARGVT